MYVGGGGGGGVAVTDGMAVARDAGGLALRDVHDDDDASSDDDGVGGSIDPTLHRQLHAAVFGAPDGFGSDSEDDAAHGAMVGGDVYRVIWQ